MSVHIPDMSSSEGEEVDSGSGSEGEGFYPMLNPGMFPPMQGPMQPMQGPGAFYHPQGFMYYQCPPGLGNGYYPDGPVASVGGPPAASASDTKQPQDDISSPPTSNFVAKMPLCRQTVNDLEEVSLGFWVPARRTTCCGVPRY